LGRLLKLIERIRRQVGRELSDRVEVFSCYEAGYDGFWLHRLPHGGWGAQSCSDPASLLVNRRARRAKTDRIDVERMLRALNRYLRGEPDACSVCGFRASSRKMPAACIASATG